jgi:16S rRNA (cytosine1402-N4)-methyltransferase
LLAEAVESLRLKPGLSVLDATLGGGGHAAEILKRIRPGGRLIGIDRDPAALDRCRKILEGGDVSLHHANYSKASEVLDSLNIDFVDAVILDAGFSSDQLEDAARGFSFEREGPLDMRMDPGIEKTAKDLIYDLSKSDLEDLFRRYGEERWARRFAERICEARREKPIETTLDLAGVIESAMPVSMRFKKGHRPPWARHNPATKVFQALRISVNDELGSLAGALPVLWARVRPGGRMAVISFHSLEDRIVKHQFKDWALRKEGTLIVKKPVVPSEAEIRDNSRARSAKLRVVEKNEIRS